MAITLSRADYDLLWKQANPLPKMSEKANFVERRSSFAEALPSHSHAVCEASPQALGISYVPEQLGQGYIQKIQWRGINLMLFNYQFHNDVSVKGRSQDTDRVCREIGFNLSGNLCGKHTGESFIEWGSDDDDDAEWTSTTYANDRVRKVDIHVESSEALVHMIAESLDALPKAVAQQIKEGNWLGEVNAITPAMRVALEQIFHCPFHGKTQEIYLEGKCLELIALKLEQLKERVNKTERSCALKPDDIERIHFAKDILTENLEHPPSLLALARQVNLNDYKLKVGFRQVFGTTVFGYLHQYRMDRAHRLLAEQRLNVKEVAQAVGYTNQSQFAAAFRKQFGMNPKAYVLSTRS